MVAEDSHKQTNLLNLSFDEAMDLLVCIDTTLAKGNVYGTVYRQSLRDLRKRIVDTFKSPSLTSSWCDANEY